MTRGRSPVSWLSVLIVAVAVAADAGAAVRSRSLRFVALVPATVVAACFAALALHGRGGEDGETAASIVRDTIPMVGY